MSDALDLEDDEFLAGLTAGLTPVRPRGHGAEGGILVAVCAIQLIGFAVLMRTVPFTGAADIAPVAGTVKAAVFGLGALLMSVLALRSATPGRRDRRAVAWGGAALLLAAALIGLEWTAVQPGMAGKPVMAGQDGTLFAPQDGVRCLLSSLSLALPVGLALTLMARAAAPLRPHATSALIGAASGFWGGFVYAAQCPYVSAVYVITWYGAAVVLGTLVGRYVLGKRLAW